MIIGEREEEAYKKLMSWQYAHIKENASVFNFMLETSYLELKHELKPATTTPQKEREKQEIEEAYNELIENKQLNEKETSISDDNVQREDEKQNSIWHNTIDKLKSMGFTICIFFIFFGALVCVIVYRKKIDIKDVGRN